MLVKSKRGKGAAKKAAKIQQAIDKIREEAARIAAELKETLLSFDTVRNESAVATAAGAAELEKATQTLESAKEGKAKEAAQTLVDELQANAAVLHEAEVEAVADIQLAVDRLMEAETAINDELAKATAALYKLA